ncbi:MAG: hypothetical protein AAFQ82_04740 [Myxococcota bacterium]
MSSEAPPLEAAISATLSRSWDIFKQDFVLYLLATLAVAILGAVSLGILIAPLSVGLIMVIRRKMAGDASVGVGDIFQGFSKFVPALLASIAIFIGVFIGSILLVLPGLFVAFVVSYTFHVMVYEEAGMVESIKRSVRLTLDNALFTLLMLVIAGVINGIGAVVAVGGLVTGPFTAVMLTVAYEEITK